MGPPVMAEAAPEGDRYTFLPILRPSGTTVAVVVASRRVNLTLVPTGSRPDSISSCRVGVLLSSMPIPPSGRSSALEGPWTLSGGEKSSPSRAGDRKGPLTWGNDPPGALLTG